MMIKKYLYSLVYSNFEEELCMLESKSIFDKKAKNKLLFSDIKIEPSNSAFIKHRLDIINFSKDYSALIDEIKKENIRIEGFKVEYIVLDGDKTTYDTRLEKLKDIGYSIEGIPDYYKPTITYAICNYKGTWCFGILIKNKYVWQKHNKKPYSYSNSINIHIAKALVNIASKGNKEVKLIDACCGVGTIMLEACFAEYNIEGCDINWKISRQARENLSHFNYNSSIYCSDIKDINKRYDAAIIDLPYNLFSTANDDTLTHIIESTMEITDQFVIVSISDIESLISNLGLKITDSCSVGKSGKVKFARNIWVCEK